MEVKDIDPGFVPFMASEWGELWHRLVGQWGVDIIHMYSSGTMPPE